MIPLKVFWLLFIFMITIHANPAINSNDNTIHAMNRNQLEEGFLRKLNGKCSQRDNHSCMMLKVIVYMDRMLKKSSIEISENLQVTQTRNPEISDDQDDDLILARSTRSDEESLGVIIAEKIWKFIRSRMIRYKLYDNADLVVVTEPRGNLNIGLSISPHQAIETGRGKMKNLGPIIAAIAAKIGIIGALFIKGLILLAGKALIVSKVALVLAVIIALKKLLNKKHVTYEVLPHGHGHHEPPQPPHHIQHSAHSGHDSYSSGWARRAFDGFMDGLEDIPAKMLTAQDLAYSAQKSLI